MPSQLHNILIGLLLGDGYIYRSSLTRNCRFKISFGQNRQRYANFLGSIFKEYITNEVKAIKVGTKKLTSYRLKTITNPVFNTYYDIFYRVYPLKEKNKNMN
jgi:LAGLIDADG DNA endonuclease family